MGTIVNDRNFFRMQVDILRPAFAVDVTTNRDRVLTNYVVIKTSARAFIEPIHSERIMNKQIGGIEVARAVGFFLKNENIQVNDVIRELSNPYNSGNVYWEVLGKLDYSRYGYHVRVDLGLMNYQRGQNNQI